VADLIVRDAASLSASYLLFRCFLFIHGAKDEFRAGHCSNLAPLLPLVALCIMWRNVKFMMFQLHI
jgi:hypothetical protein